MNKKAVEYREKRLSTIRVIKDFLPKPDALVLKDESMKEGLFLTYFRLYTLP